MDAAGSLSLAEEISHCAPHDAAALLAHAPDDAVARALEDINPMLAQQILHELSNEKRCAILAAAPIEKAHQWMHNQQYKQDTVGLLMEPPVAVFRPHQTIRETIQALAVLTKKAYITYGYVTDERNKLLGVLVMRDLMLGDPDKPLSEVMWTRIFSLTPDMSLYEAAQAALNRHVPVYPVCDEQGRLLGLVRGQSLFEARALQLSAQAGSMMGVEKEERLSTPVMRSLTLRHPLLQINLLTAFTAAALAGLFQARLDNVLILAVFLPVLAGQCGNAGSQSLAVALRGLTLGEIQGQERRLVLKEGLLGLLNGALVGITAGFGMWAYAIFKGYDHGLQLGAVVFMAMVGSCLLSGLLGAAIPLVLKRFGSDPASASSLFLTTATDIVSMSFFLGLAHWLVL
jgi:magnesium transporter